MCWLIFRVRHWDALNCPHHRLGCSCKSPRPRSNIVLPPTPSFPAFSRRQTTHGDLQTMPPHDHEPNSRKLKQRATLGCTEQVQVARQVRRDHRSQDPWIARKLAVMIVMGLVAYSTYVYVRMCVDMIRERRGALGSRAEGSKSHPYTHSSEFVLILALVHPCGKNHLNLW